MLKSTIRWPSYCHWKVRRRAIFKGAERLIHDPDHLLE